MKIGKIHSFIVNAGVNPNDSEEVQYKLRALNKFSFYTILIALLYGVIFFWVDWKGPLCVVIFDYIFFGSVIFFNYRQSFVLAKFMLVLTSALSVLSITLMMGFESGFHLYLLTSPLFVFWLYDITDLKNILLSFCIYMLVFIFIFFFKGYYTPVYNFQFNISGVGINTYSLNLFINLIFLFVLFYNYSHYYKILTDSLIQKQKHLEVEIDKRIESEDRIQKLFFDLTQSYNRVKQFNYIVSHNLKAPLSNIKGFLNLYDKKVFDENKSRELMEYIGVATKNLDEVITDLNYILKSNNQLLDRKEEVNLRELISDVKNALTDEIKKSDAQIIETYPETINLSIVKTIFHSVLFNIIQNSIKYGKDGIPPFILIDVIENANGMIIKITDNGIGIDLNKHGDRIFNLYSRFHKRDVQGKGLGLYLVKNHMEMIGGSIHLESKPNEGTTLFLRIDRD